jgi:hypothetical protein
MPITNVELSNTFNQFRTTTNLVIAEVNKLENGTALIVANTGLANTFTANTSLRANTITTTGAFNLTLHTNGGTNSGNIVIGQGVNGNITVEPNGTGDVFLNTDIVRIGDQNLDATLTTWGTGNLTLSTNTGTNSGTISIANGVNGNITLTPNGTGDVLLSADTVVVGDAAAAATITTNGAGNLTLSTNSGTNSGTILINQGTNANIVIAPNGTGDVQLDADTVRVGDAAVDATITTNGAANLTISTNSGTNSGTIAIANGVNGNISLTPNGTGTVSVPRLSSSGQITSTVATGTAPLVVASTTVVANLNADSVDGISIGTVTGAGGIVYGTSTTAIAGSAAGVSGQAVISGGSGAPTFQNVASANGASSIVARDAAGSFAGNVITAQTISAPSIASSGSLIANTVTTSGAFDITISTNSGTNSGTIGIANGVNGNISLTPNGTGDVLLVADTVQIGDAGAAATLTTNGAGNLTLSTNSGTNSGTIVINQGTNANIVLTPNGTGDVQLDADTVRVGDSGAAATITTNGAGNLSLSTNSGTNSGTIAINQGVNGNIDFTPNGTGLTRAVNSGDAIFRAERTGATATTFDQIARNGFGELATSTGRIQLNPFNQAVEVDGRLGIFNSSPNALLNVVDTRNVNSVYNANTVNSINTTANTITFTATNSGISNGDMLFYSPSATAITGLTANFFYYAKTVNANTVELHTTYTNAITTGTTPVVITGTLPGGTHTFLKGTEWTQLSGNNGNASLIHTYQYRHTDGNDWTGVGSRIQQRIDVTPQAYLEFNPAGGQTSISFGTGSGPTLSEALRINGSQNLILGNGETSAAPVARTVRMTNGVGTNIAAATMSIQGGLSTGNATGGAVRILTGTIGSTGATLQTAAERFRIDPSASSTQVDVVMPATVNFGRTSTTFDIGSSSSTATFNGNLTVGGTSKASNTVITVAAGDSNIAGFEAYGGSQGHGYLYVGQSQNFGGGISYSGDGTPGFIPGEVADRITFFRRDTAANNYPVFDYSYVANTVTFYGDLTLNTGLVSVPSTGAQFERLDTSNTSVVYPITSRHLVTNTPALGIGTGIAFTVETTDNNPEVGMTIDAVTTDVAATTEDFDFVVKLMQNGAAAAERFRVASTGTATLAGSLLSSQATAGLFDATTTTVNFAGAATTGNFGYDGTATSTTNLSIGATASGSTKTVNIGTAGAAGSTTNINLGSTAGAGTIVLNTRSYFANTFYTGRGYQLTSELSTNVGPKANTSNTETFSVYIGRMKSGLSKIRISTAGWGAEESAEVTVFVGYDGTSNTGDKFVSSHISEWSSPTGYTELTSFHTAKVDAQTVDLFLVYTLAVGVPAAQSHQVYWTAEGTYAASSTDGFTRPSGVTIPTLNATNILPVTLKYNESGFLVSTNATFSQIVNAVDFNTTSDQRLKVKYGTGLFDGPELIKRINPYKYTWKESGKISYGVFAQELEEIMPELISEREDGFKGVSYTPLIAVLIDTVKKQQDQINKLQEIVNRLV